MTKSLAHTKWMCKYHIIFTLKQFKLTSDNNYLSALNRSHG